jgi:hypothetical protein
MLKSSHRAHALGASHADVVELSKEGDHVSFVVTLLVPTWALSSCTILLTYATVTPTSRIDRQQEVRVKIRA